MTPRREEVLAFVREFIGAGHPAASVPEIASAIGLGVANTYRLITALVDAGHLERTAGEPRSIRLPTYPSLAAVPNAVLAAELARRGVTLASLDPKMPIACGAEKTCAADTCGAPVRPGQLMCLTHWRALPHALQQRVLATNRQRDRDGYQSAVTEARDLIDGGEWRRRA